MHDIRKLYASVLETMHTLISKYDPALMQNPSTNEPQEVEDSFDDVEIEFAENSNIDNSNNNNNNVDEDESEDEISDFEDNEDEDEDEDNLFWTKKDANTFQNSLITLLLFVIGGQRKQLISWFSLKVE